MEYDATSALDIRRRVPNVLDLGRASDSTTLSRVPPSPTGSKLPAVIGWAAASLKQYSQHGCLHRQATGASVIFT